MFQTSLQEAPSLIEYGGVSVNFFLFRTDPSEQSLRHLYPTAQTTVSCIISGRSSSLIRTSLTWQRLCPYRMIFLDKERLNCWSFRSMLTITFHLGKDLPTNGIYIKINWYFNNINSEFILPLIVYQVNLFRLTVSTVFINSWTCSQIFVTFIVKPSLF